MIENNVQLNETLKRLYSRLKRQVFIQELSRKELIFTYGNDKLKKMYTFSLPAGHACPGANQCMSKADRHGGGLTDGPNCQFRCFAASEEARLTEVRLIRWHNFDKLRACKTTEAIVNLIVRSLPQDAKMIRVHVSGDYYSETYFMAWLEVARLNPHIVFYSYTKSLPIWLKHRQEMPSNFRITASYGGRWDNLIVANGLKYSLVVKSEVEAAALGLEIDHDDSHAWEGDKSFALVIHATQPPGSEFSKAWTSILMAQRAEPKPIKRQINRKPTTTMQWIARIFKMVARLLAAGGSLTNEDATLVGSLTINAGVVPLPQTVLELA